MSTKIDLVRESGEPGQGFWARMEGVGKTSTTTLDDHYRFSARSATLTWQPAAKRSPRPFADELKTKMEVKSLFAGFLLLACNGLGDLPVARHEVFTLQCTNTSKNFAY